MCKITQTDDHDCHKEYVDLFSPVQSTHYAVIHDAKVAVPPIQGYLSTEENQLVS